MSNTSGTHTGDAAAAPSQQEPNEPTETPQSQRRRPSWSFRPPTLRRGSRSNATASTFDAQPTIHSNYTNGERPNYNRFHTAASTIQRLRTTNDSVAPPERLERQRTEKKQEQTIPIENNYYSLNPWYDQKPEKPVFGLAQPLPRTVRPGMLWGRHDLRDQLYKVEDKKDPGEAERRWGKGNALEDSAKDEAQRARGSRSTGADREWSSDFNEDYFSNQQPREVLEEATPTFHVPITQHRNDAEGEEEARSPPERFLTNVNGQPRVIRRVDPEEADQVLRERGLQEDRGIDEHGLRIPESRVARGKERGTFGLQDGLPPLQEVRSSESDESFKTMKEKEEIQDREEQALREYYDTYRNPLARFRAKYPQALAEFLATSIALFLGLCGNLSVLTSDSQQGGFQTQAWGWGLSVMTGIYLGGGVSGAHLNPCVSISLSLYRGFPWKLCTVYILMQLLAGLVAGGLSYLVYHDAIMNFDPDLTPDITGKAFYTLPQPWVSVSTAFFTEFISTAILTCVVFALGDDQNSPPGAGMNALILGLVIYLLVITLGYNTGAAIGPARDFGPRLVALWAGYGTQTFTDGWWAYGPWGAALSGSVVGGLLYDSLVFVGGESPVNYRWPRPGEIRWRAKQSVTLAKKNIQEVV